MGPAFGEAHSSFSFRVFLSYTFAFVGVAALIMPILNNRADLRARLKLFACGQAVLLVLVNVVGGGSFVSRMMGGEPADTDLIRLVHSVANDIGVPPPAYVHQLPTGEMNAFVTGVMRNDLIFFNTTIMKKDTTVTITRGLRNTLWTTELKAVVAHELAHIHNGDVITNTHLAVIGAGLGAVYEFGDYIYEEARLKNDENMTRIGSMVKLGGSALKMLGDLHRFAVSRDNEYRADAMAASVYGPSPMANALARIDWWATFSTRDKLKRFDGAISHACIAPDPSMALAYATSASSDMTNRWRRLFMTHPHTQDRIAVLMNGTYNIRD